MNQYLYPIYSVLLYFSLCISSLILYHFDRFMILQVRSPLFHHKFTPPLPTFSLLARLHLSFAFRFFRSRTLGEDVCSA